ncbi:MAG: hypothetical protein R3D87_01385 [Paracoccaceae bacterium]
MDASDAVDTLGMTVNLKMMREADERFYLAITWGFMIPVLAMLVWIITRRVYRGFRSPNPDG